jgi:cell division protein FtsI/penicillin-binding protein 2
MLLHVNDYFRVARRRRFGVRALCATLLLVQLRSAILCALVLASAGTAAAPPPPTPLQRAVARAMRAQRGSLLVVDVRGQVPVLLAAHRIESAARRVATPGSTVKTFVLLKLLETGKARPSDLFVCPRQVRVGGRRIDCTHPELPGPIDPADALAWSCNAYFAEVARRLTPAELHEALERAGLETYTGLTPDEGHGQLLPADTQERLQLQALGHWGVTTTPAALLYSYIRLAGRRDDPNVRLVWQGLERSVAFGMAHAAHVDKMQIAGKTGTASDGPGGPTHGWFVGLAPAADPEIAIVVYLERGRGADAAALAQPVFAAYFQDARKQ